MTPERLEEISRTLCAVKRGEYNYHYQAYVTDVDELIAHIEVQDKKIEKLADVIERELELLDDNEAPQEEFALLWRDMRQAIDNTGGNDAE
jgi:glycerol-3-phosphate dehydrogenase